MLYCVRFWLLLLMPVFVNVSYIERVSVAQMMMLLGLSSSSLACHSTANGKLLVHIESPKGRTSFGML